MHWSMLANHFKQIGVEGGGGLARRGISLASDENAVNVDCVNET